MRNLRASPLLTTVLVLLAVLLGPWTWPAFAADDMRPPELERAASPTAGGKIAGRVTESGSGAGLGHLGVPLFVVDEKSVSHFAAGPAMTDDAGAFAFDHLRAGVYRIVGEGDAVGPDGGQRRYFFSAKDDVAVTSGSVSTVALSAEAAATVRGRALEQGADIPLAGARVTAPPGQVLRQERRDRPARG